MLGEDEILQRMLAHALSGEGAHVEVNNALEGLDWKLAGVRPTGGPHSIYQLVNHMVYWNVWVVRWLDGEDPPIPEHASGSWPGTVGPAKGEDWERAVTRFATSVDELIHRAHDGDLFSTRVAVGAMKSPLEMLQTIASHNSYHLGQTVFLRQTRGAWPPPSGGLSW